MATKNKHRRKNASNAVSRQHKRRLCVDNRTRAYTEIRLVNICVSIVFTGSFFVLLGFFPRNGNVILWLQHLLIDISNCCAAIGLWFMACETQGQSPTASGEEVYLLGFVHCLESLWVLQISCTSAAFSQGYSLVSTYKMFEKSFW